MLICLGTWFPRFPCFCSPAPGLGFGKFAWGLLGKSDQIVSSDLHREITQTNKNKMYDSKALLWLVQYITWRWWCRRILPYVYPVPLWEEAVGKPTRIKIYIFDIIDDQNFCQFYHISFIFLSSFFSIFHISIFQLHHNGWKCFKWLILTL